MLGVVVRGAKLPPVESLVRALDACDDSVLTGSSAGVAIVTACCRDDSARVGVDGCTARRERSSHAAGGHDVNDECSRTMCVACWCAPFDKLCA
jgi:hypothetical protein